MYLNLSLITGDKYEIYKRQYNKKYDRVVIGNSTKREFIVKKTLPNFLRLYFIKMRLQFQFIKSSKSSTALYLNSSLIVALRVETAVVLTKYK